MADKTTKHTLRNIERGPRGVNAATGYVEIAPGQTVEGVELTEAELASAEATGYFEIDDTTDPAEDGEALPAKLPALKKLAKDEGVNVTGLTSATDYQNAILAHRKATAGDDLDKLSDDDLRATAAAIAGREVPADATRADLLKLARGQ